MKKEFLLITYDEIAKIAWYGVTVLHDCFLQCFPMVSIWHFISFFFFSCNMLLIGTVVSNIHRLKPWRALDLPAQRVWPRKFLLRAHCCHFKESEDLRVRWPWRPHTGLLPWCQHKEPLRAPPTPMTSPMAHLRGGQRRGLRLCVPGSGGSACGH